MSDDDEALREQRDFWSAISGSRVARRLGIVAGAPDSTEIFDNWFFWYYPYLADERFIPWSALTGKLVLEIGLGYGSTFRRLAQRGANVVGVDIADGPLRLSRDTSSGRPVVAGSALDLPFADQSIDAVVAIGSIHHTGDIPRAIAECHRVLKPGGVLVAMLYYRWSYKRLILGAVTAPLSAVATLRRRVRRTVAWFYDRDPQGRGAPVTGFVGRRELRRMLTGFDIETAEVVNVDNLQDLLPAAAQHRALDAVRIAALRLPVWRLVGLDLYVVARRRDERSYRDG